MVNSHDSDGLSQWLLACKQTVDHAIEIHLRDVGAPQRIADILFPGRRIRPSLYLVASASVERPVDPSVFCALEYIHAASIIVDDILDQDDGRRGYTRLDERVGTSSVLVSHQLVGLGLLVHGLGEERQQQLLGAYAQMCRGEFADLFETVPVHSAHPSSQLRASAFFGPSGRTWHQHYDQEVLLKTAPLFRCALQWAGGSENADSFGSIGTALGRAFQMSNDLFDLSEAGRAQRHGQKESYPLSLSLPLALLFDAGGATELVQRIHVSGRPSLYQADWRQLWLDIESNDVHMSARKYLDQQLQHVLELAEATPLATTHWLQDFCAHLADLSLWTKDYDAGEVPALGRVGG